MKAMPLQRMAAAAAAIVLTACATTPPPQWQLDAQRSIGLALAAYWQGDTHAETVEATRARDALAATGQPALLARMQLTRCAARVASLVFEPCAGFEALRVDAAAAELAYADYLAGRASAQQAELLPAAQRGAATASAEQSAQVLGAIEDPLSRLVAAGVMFASGRASPAAIALAADTASAQGWRRPLLAWLGVQRELAARAGDRAAAERLQRRIARVLGEP